jgi:hypothetical protein
MAKIYPVNWNELVDTARRGAVDLGYKMERVPKKGLSNIWQMTKGDQSRRVAIRTTRDRWFTFLPLEGGAKWKTLDEVEMVLVAALDSQDKAIEVYLFTVDEVRKRFDAAYKARKEANHVLNDNFGFWINLDVDKRQTATSVGSGLADDFKPVATYPLGDAVTAPTTSAAATTPEADETPLGEWQPGSIAEAMDWVRHHIARIAGVKTDAVKLDLKVEY